MLPRDEDYEVKVVATRRGLIADYSTDLLSTIVSVCGKRFSLSMNVISFRSPSRLVIFHNWRAARNEQTLFTNHDVLWAINNQAQ